LHYISSFWFIRANFIRANVVTLMFIVTSTVAYAKDSLELNNWDTQLPRIQSLVDDIQQLQTLGNKHIVVLHGTSKNYTKEVKSNQPGHKVAPIYPLPNKDIHLTYAFTVINASKSRVQRTLLDFGNYKNTMPQVIESKLLQQQANHWLGEYRLKFSMPSITFKPQIKIQHTLLANGDLIERRVDGDIEYSIARWQIIPLSMRRCLLLQTSWVDVGSINLLMRVIFAAQPDLGRLSPLSAAALTIQSIKLAIENKRRYRVSPIQTRPVFPDNINNLTTLTTKQLIALKNLTRFGTVSMISPAVLFKHPDYRFAMQPILNAISVPLNAAALKPLATNIKNYPDHMQAISDISKVRDNQKTHRSHWTLGFDFSIFTFNMDFSIEGLWNKDQTELIFASTSGDFDPLLGKINWYPDGNNTLVTMAMAHNISDDAGFILKAIKNTPYSQMFAGSFIGNLLIEGQQQLAN